MQVNSSDGSLQNRYFSGTGSIGGRPILVYIVVIYFRKRSGCQISPAAFFSIKRNGTMNQVRKNGNEFLYQCCMNGLYSI